MNGVVKWAWYIHILPSSHPCSAGYNVRFPILLDALGRYRVVCWVYFPALFTYRILSFVCSVVKSESPIVFKGKIQRKRKWGRPRSNWITETCTDIRVRSCLELKRSAEKRGLQDWFSGLNHTMTIMMMVMIWWWWWWWWCCCWCWWWWCCGYLWWWWCWWWLSIDD